MTDEQPAKRGPGRPPKRPVGRPSDYKPEYCEKVIDLGEAGNSFTQIAHKIGHDKASLLRWAEAHEEFRTRGARSR